MSEMDWIMSDGGPLICMEERLANLWGGMDRLTFENKSGAENDYERACQCQALMNNISLSGGCALVLGDEPFNTSFWQAANGALFLVRVQWAESLADIGAILKAANITRFQSVEEDIDFVFHSKNLILFDSVEDGTDVRASIRQSLAQGKYKISTKIYNHDSLTSLYVHELAKLPDV